MTVADRENRNDKRVKLTKNIQTRCRHSRVELKKTDVNDNSRFITDTIGAFKTTIPSLCFGLKITDSPPKCVKMARDIVYFVVAGPN